MEKLTDLRYCTAQSLTFSTFSSEEIKKLSAVKIITPLSFNALGYPLPGGLYDPALGPIEINSQCTTCKQKLQHCPGHMGYIELPLPVINPLYYKTIASVLKISCLECHTVLIPNVAKKLLFYQLKLLEKGYFAEAKELESKASLFASTSWEAIHNCNYDVNKESIILSELEKEVSDLLKRDVLSIQEVKGEGELRNTFIKTALSHLFKGKRCPYCKQLLKKVSLVQNKLLIEGGKINVASKFKDVMKGSETPAAGWTFLTPKDCNNHLYKIWLTDDSIMTAIIPMLKNSKERNPVDGLFMNCIFVTPTNTRPVNKLDGIITEHPQNHIYKAILNDCLVLKSIILSLNNQEDSDSLSAERKEVIERLKGRDLSEKLQYAWQELQINVDSLLDVDLRKVRHANGIGLKQIIEKKQGILRMNMMGKRVNFAARTVITPDPNLNIDEIGIPEAFAKKLTYPVPVTVWNVTELRKLVMNGPDVHPGANFIEDEERKIIKIDKNDKVNREGIAKRLLTPGVKGGLKVVHRHLVNGDILLLNRQPTLHRPSIMAHKARVLKGEKTFRLHYANCKSYNADFDGDEMNAHFPQNEVARSEGYNLVSVCKNYLVPKDGTPLSGLIQDHVVSGVRLTLRGKMFTKSDYMQLVFQGLSSIQGNIRILKPCILKPVQLWSGKQVISTILLNIIPKDKVPINLTSKAKISHKAWLKGSSRPWIAGGTPFKDENTMSEAEVVIRGGELLCGVLDKTHYGATPYSLVHCMYELYGGEVSSACLSSFSKLFTAYLQFEGFTLGVEDILVLKNADVKRTNFIKKSREIGDEIVSKVVEVPSGSTLKNEIAQNYAKDPSFRSLLDHKYKTTLDEVTNNVNKTCIPSGLLTPFPNNNLQLMVQSGAKGSTVNTMQISCLLGQIELEGKRPPLMISGKSLPSFPSHDTSPRAGGFIDGRFMTGIKPQEFFFHCMAGREGLIDTAVKTSRSGYLQRCLVKHLEGLNVNYDMTVRDSDSTVVQFLYGEDGMEVTKCQFLKESQLPFLMDNMNAVRDTNVLEVFKENSAIEAIKNYNKIIKKWRKVTSEQKEKRRSPFLLFSEEKRNITDGSSTIQQGTGRSHEASKLCKMWFNLPAEEKLRYEKMCWKTPDTLVSRFQPDRNYGAITERMDQLISNYLKTRKGEVKEKTVRGLVCEKVLSSLCPPGEPVGLLAAQSVGEPSTQMTLNTFHFAGRGEMNVTLGIPRLREILMVASKNIKTPSMVIPFKDLPKLDYHVNKLKRKLNRITLADVLQTIYVQEKLHLKPRRQLYILKMKFLPHEAYAENTIVTPKQILKHVEKKFLKNFFQLLRIRGKRAKDLITSETIKEGQAHGDDSEDDDEGKSVKKPSRSQKFGTQDDYQSSEDEPEGDDDDATTARRRDRQQEEHQYSDLEDEDKSVQDEVATEDMEDVWGSIEEEVKPSVEEIDRTSYVKKHHYIIDYKYDTIKEEWCEVAFGINLSVGHVDIYSKLKEICQASVIHEVPGIKRAIIQNDKEGKPTLRTDGLNLYDIFSYDNIIDLKKLYTNDVHAMAAIYGIDAAASVIVKEVQDVFKVYGITVDPRHLNLIAAYMTFSGTYQPLSRKGMEDGASPLQQMSFESSLGFLKTAVLREKKDDLSSPSSRLMLGAPVKSGTGSFRLLQKITSV